MTSMALLDRPLATFHCTSCGEVPTKATTEQGMKCAISHHARKHRTVIDVRPRSGGRYGIAEPVLSTEPAQRVLARSASLRLNVVAAIHRIGMWQACPAMDAARNADQVLDEVRQLLEEDSR